MSPVRAKPTMGFSARSAATIGSTVKPTARLCGTTISKPLQIVGVSHWLSRSRSAMVKGRSVIAVRPAIETTYLAATDAAPGGRALTGKPLHAARIEGHRMIQEFTDVR